MVNWPEISPTALNISTTLAISFRLSRAVDSDRAGQMPQVANFPRKSCSLNRQV
jgi:hypothetical protein